MIPENLPLKKRNKWLIVNLYGHIIYKFKIGKKKQQNRYTIKQ